MITILLFAIIIIILNCEEETIFKQSKFIRHENGNKG